MCINYIGIDPSITCTGMVINNNKFIYTTKKLALTKNDVYNKWFKYCSKYCSIKLYNNDNYKLYDYNISELRKLQMYDVITDDIISTIQNNIIPSSDSILYMEGYSYSALAGPLIDLVGFSTILRLKIIHNISKKLYIIPPATLKLEAAKLAYTPIMRGNKATYRNNAGIRGGKFKKREMLMALLDLPCTDDAWVNFLRSNKTELLSKKSIPKPIDDINDALILYTIASNTI